MAKTPVKLEVDGYKEREVMMVKYEFGNRRRRPDVRNSKRRKNQHPSKSA